MKFIYGHWLGSSWFDVIHKIFALSISGHPYYKYTNFHNFHQRLQNRNVLRKKRPSDNSFRFITAITARIQGITRGIRYTSFHQMVVSVSTNLFHRRKYPQQAVRERDTDPKQNYKS